MFFEQFYILCKSENTTPTEFVKNVLKLSSSKVTAWKNGSIPKYETLKAIAEHFDVTIGTLFDGKPNVADDDCPLSEEENELISDFRSLSDQGRKYIKEQMFMAKEVYKKQSVFDKNIKVG